MDELCPWTRFSLAEILVLVGDAIPPAPVPASTRISAGLKRVLGHSSLVNVRPRADGFNHTGDIRITPPTAP